MDTRQDRRRRRNRRSTPRTQSWNPPRAARCSTKTLKCTCIQNGGTNLTILLKLTPTTHQTYMRLQTQFVPSAHWLWHVQRHVHVDVHVDELLDAVHAVLSPHGGIVLCFYHERPTAVGHIGWSVANERWRDGRPWCRWTGPPRGRRRGGLQKSAPQAQRGWSAGIRQRLVIAMHCLRSIVSLSAL
jgi:hypothetical protein